MNEEKRFMWVEPFKTNEVVAIAASNGAAVAGPRLVARGLCPGRMCRKPQFSMNPTVIRQAIERHPGKLGDTQCKACGQHIEAYARRLVGT